MGQSKPLLELGAYSRHLLRQEGKSRLHFRQEGKSRLLLRQEGMYDLTSPRTGGRGVLTDLSSDYNGMADLLYI